MRPATARFNSSESRGHTTSVVKALPALALLFVTACGGKGSSDPVLSDQGVTAIKIVTPMRMIVGQEYEIQVEAFGASGNQIAISPNDVNLDFATPSATTLVRRTDTGFQVRITASVDQVFEAKYKLNPTVIESAESRLFGVWTGTWTAAYKLGTEDWTTTLDVSEFGTDIVGTMDSAGGTSHFIDNVGGAATDLGGTKAKLVSQAVILTQGTRTATTSFDGTYTDIEQPRLAGALVPPAGNLNPPSVVFNLVSR